jgi:hypothetical protein
MNVTQSQTHFYVVVNRNANTNRPLKETWRDSSGDLQSYGDLPAIVEYDELTGNVTRRVWIHENAMHRVGGPALENIDPNTKVVTYEAWFEHGKTHRSGDLPAVIERDEKTGKVTVEAFFEHGKRHRASGPALYGYHQDTGRKIVVSYWQNGRQVLKSEMSKAAPEI